MVSHAEAETWVEGFENRVLRRIVVPKANEVTGDWCSLHENLHDTY